MSMVMINNDNFNKEVVESKEFMLVIFGAPWCNHCVTYHPVVAEFAQKHPEIKICGNNVDESTKAAQHFNITLVPTTIIMKNGEEVLRTVGSSTLAELEASVAANR